MIKSVFVLVVFFLAYCSNISCQPKILKSEFIYDSASFPSCHASTIAETPDGMVTAFFGGTAEGRQDVGIWMSRNCNGKWTEPSEVATGLQADGNRFPCWNPVLYKYNNGPLVLFYKVGPSPSKWWGMMTVSPDNGNTWGKHERLPSGFMGPVKNKPVMLKNATLLCPSSTEENGWSIQIEMTSDYGKTWSKSLVNSDNSKFSAIQPAILIHQGNKLQILCRTKEGVIAESWSDDTGETWTFLEATSLPNPNSGIDALTLKNGNQMLVYNPVTTRAKGGSGQRTPLVVSISSDGKVWKNVVTLESAPGEYSYPAIIQTSDGLIHITYTWNRKKIKHVVIDP
jgi:predicted neuraminidase